MQVEKFDVFGVNANIFICVTDCMSEEDLRINWRKYVMNLLKLINWIILMISSDGTSIYFML